MEGFKKFIPHSTGDNSPRSNLGLDINNDCFRSFLSEFEHLTIISISFRLAESRKENRFRFHTHQDRDYVSKEVIF